MATIRVLHLLVFASTPKALTPGGTSPAVTQLKPSQPWAGGGETSLEAHSSVQSIIYISLGFVYFLEDPTNK